MTNKVTTGEVRLSYVNILKPYDINGGDDPKYSVTVLIPKSDKATLERIKAAMEAAEEIGLKDKWNGTKPVSVPNPMHDGDGLRSNGEKFSDECHGHYVMTVKSNIDYPPEVVDAKMNPIINPAEVYSGMYGRVHITFFPYNFNGRKGIGASLGPVQKTRDGEPLGGARTSAADVFGTFEEATPAQAEQFPF
jgi:hypothetical protein